VKKSMVDSRPGRALPRSGPLSVDDFNSAEWEIIYLCFVEEGLIDPPN
jgi:hypothetical protein